MVDIGRRWLIVNGERPWAVMWPRADTGSDRRRTRTGEAGATRNGRNGRRQALTKDAGDQLRSETGGVWWQTVADNDRWWSVIKDDGLRTAGDHRRLVADGFRRRSVVDDDRRRWVAHSFRRPLGAHGFR